MSASEEQRAEWLDPRFWERLDHLEGRHQRLQAEHEHARRALERTHPAELRSGRSQIERSSPEWERYCTVIAELDQTTAEFEALRTGISADGP